MSQFYESMNRMGYELQTIHCKNADSVSKLDFSIWKQEMGGILMWDEKDASHMPENDSTLCIMLVFTAVNFLYHDSNAVMQE